MSSKIILSIRSPSPTIHTIRRRSPSPIKTGVVNRARTRFETSGCEQGGHQTLPRAFKLGASSRVNIAERTVAPKSGLSGPMRTSEPLVTSSYRTDMVQVGFYLRRGTSTQIYKSILPSSFLPFFLPSFLLKGSKKHLGARKAVEHRLLRPLSSELRSEVTSEATGSLRGHF